MTPAELEATSKEEGGLLIYSNALLASMKHVTGAFEEKYPWINVDVTDYEDPVVFSKYAAEHGTGSSTADILIASAPGLWSGAVEKGFVQDYTPTGLSSFPKFISQGGGLYIFSADPAITIYNKTLLNGEKPPATVEQIAEDGINGKYKVATYAINNNFGYTAFWAYVHEKGWPALEKLGQTAQTPGDGDVLFEDLARGAYSVATFESGLARGAIEGSAGRSNLIGWEYTKDFTPLIARGIGITAGAASPASAKLFLNFVYSHEGQQALCDAGFEAASNTFKPANGCKNTLQDLYKEVGGRSHTYMTPFTKQVAEEQESFTQKFHEAFGQ